MAHGNRKNRVGSKQYARMNYELLFSRYTIYDIRTTTYDIL
jgi:hypothetical protein